VLANRVERGQRLVRLGGEVALRRRDTGDVQGLVEAVAAGRRLDRGAAELLAERGERGVAGLGERGDGGGLARAVAARLVVVVVEEVAVRQLERLR
jgi:hypothetical protein